MKFGNIFKRSLALLLVLASVLGLVPAIYAMEVTYDPVENMLVAELDENGELVYSPASEQVKAAVRATTVTEQASTIFSAKMEPRVAIFVDPDCKENSSFAAFDLSTDDIANTNIDRLTGRGVTDIFVMTKDKNGTFSTTYLERVIAATSAKVYAWMHCAVDNAYIKSHNNSAQYHFRVGRKCNAYASSHSLYDSRQGYVDLGLDGYKTYFNGLVDKVEVCTGVDGVLLDSVKWGADYYGWGDDAKAYMKKSAFNAASAALANHHGYTTSTISSGTYSGFNQFSGTKTADGESLTTFANGSSADAKAYRDYRASVITGFIKSVRDNMASSLYLCVALESDWDSSNYMQSLYGQFPDNFKSHVSNGFCVVKTFYSVVGSYPNYTDSTSSRYVGTRTQWPVSMAKAVAKLGCNVMVGVDGNWPSETYGGLNYEASRYLTYYIHKSRFEINGDPSYGGDILGAALYTAGNIALSRMSISDLDTTTPYILMETVNSNIAAIKSQMVKFGVYNDTDIAVNYSDSGLTNASRGGLHSYSNLNNSGSSVASVKYYSNNDSQNSSTTTGWYVISNADTSFGSKDVYKTFRLIVPLKRFTKSNVSYSEIAFAQVRLSDTSGSYNWSTNIPSYTHYIVMDHRSCSFTEETLVNRSCTDGGYVKKTCSVCGYAYVAATSAAGHSYSSVVTAPTCTEKGYTTHTCSVCGDSYTDTEVAATGHTYVYTDNGSNHKISCEDCDYQSTGDHTYTNGVCTLCGHLLTKFLHFKVDGLENVWEWQLSGGGAVSFDTAGNGKMYGTADGSSAPYFYVPATSADTNGNVDYELAVGDVVEVRLRITNYSGEAKTVNPTVSFDTTALGAYGSELSYSTSTVNLASEDWQTVRIPISGYTVGDTVEHIKFSPFGNTVAAADIEIDYIFLGEEDRAPIVVTFVNYDGKYLDANPIDPGAGTSYNGATPERDIENNFKYTFSGWKNSSGETVNLTTATFTENETLTAQYTSEYADPNKITSTKKLVDTDGDKEDYIHDLVIDAYTYGKTQVLEEKVVTPMDITIVMDRSTSMGFPATYSDNSAFPNTDDGLSKLEDYLKTLDTSKPQGYYTASNCLGTTYTGIAADPLGLGTCSYEDMRWNSAGYWEVWQTLCIYDDDDGTLGTLSLLENDDTYKALEGADEYTGIRPGSVIFANDNFTYQQEGFGEWVPVTQAYAEFYERLNKCVTGTYIWQYTAAEIATIYFRIGVSRRGLIQESLDAFVDTIYESNANLPEGEHHRFSVVSYGRGTYVMDNNASGNKVSVELGVTTDTPITLDSADAVKTLKGYIDNPYAYGQTYTDDALREAITHVETMDSADNGRQGVVILVTDGAPTHGSSFNETVANAAITNANTIKSKDVTLFSIGFMPDIDAAVDCTGVYDDSASESDKANDFLHLVSSNYPNATSMTLDDTTKVDGNSDAGYYLSTVDGAALAGQFEAIFSEIKHETEVVASIESSIMLYDIIKREWDVIGEGTDNLDITVQRCDYLGNGEFAAPSAIDASAYSIGSLVEIPNTGGDRSLTIEWKDAPNAWLREEGIDGSTFLGYKILVTIGIQLDRDSTIGGNNIPTNGDTSGAYYPSIESPSLWTIWDVPNVNVEIIYDYLIHDYFMDLYTTGTEDLDLLTVLKNNAAKNNNKTVHGSMYTITQNVDTWNNKYVSIDHSLKSYSEKIEIDNGVETPIYTLGNAYYQQSLAAAAKTWTETTYGTGFDFAVDNSFLTAACTITQTTFEIDSLDRPAFDPVNSDVSERQVNYYAPKYAVLDFGTKVEVPLENEAYLTKGRISNKISLNDDGTNLIYDFVDGSVILSETSEFFYSVTAINTPKNATSNSINRTLTILPANNVMYEETYLTNVDGAWSDEGTVTERSQLCDNTTEHGYDSGLHNAGLNDTNSFGHAYIVTASAANNNKSMTFSFTGTGFDVISRTGPEDGVMVVEVYTDAAMTNKVRTALANNYLAEATLYQVPVVRYLDLDYGTYYVKIRAFYSDIFNPNYSAAATTSAISNGTAAARRTLAQARIYNELGFTADTEIEYFTASGASLTAKAATRGTTADTSYEVLVDGIRVYNPLGTINATDHPQAYYIYGLANEINPTFLNTKPLLLDSETWTYDGTGSEDADGLAYIAAFKSSVAFRLDLSGYTGSMEKVSIKVSYVDAGNVTAVKEYTAADLTKLGYGIYELHFTEAFSTLPNRVMTCTVYVGDEVYSTCTYSNPGNAASDSTVTGIHLSMAGKLEVEAKDGKNYLLDALGNRVKAEQYSTEEYIAYVYVKSPTENGTKLYSYHCLDADGKEQDVTKYVDVVYYNSNYDVNGPENEIYLKDNSGVVFNVGDNVDRVQVSAKSSNGNNAFLQVYSESAGKFVNIYAHSTDAGSGLKYTKNVTELYYDITDYVMSNGDVILRGPNGKLDGVKQEGILSISCVKVFAKEDAGEATTLGLSAPADSVMRAIKVFQDNALPEVTLNDGIIIGEQLSLQSDLTMNFRVKEELLTAYDLSTAYLVVERNIYPAGEEMYVRTTVLDEYTMDNGRLVFAYTGIAATEMNDEIRAVLHIKDAEGNEYVSSVLETSVTTYAKKLLEGTPVSGNEKLFTVVMDMLNYGTAAQMSFGRRTDALANEAFPIFAEYASYASTDLVTPLETVEGQIENAGIANPATMTQALDLGTRISIIYKVSLPEGVSAEDASLVIKDADGNELETIGLASGTVDSKGRYVVLFSGNTSRQMRRAVYATVHANGEAISGTYSYSICSYAHLAANTAAAPEALVNLTKLMIIYGDSATAYFG